MARIRLGLIDVVKRQSALWLVLIALLGLGCAEKPSQNIALARQHMAVLDYQAASLELKSTLESDRNLVEARWLLGLIYLELGDVRSAEKELLLAAELGWTGDDTRPALARAQLAQGKFREALRLDPEGLHPGAAARLLSTQALAELAQGRTEAAARLVAAARKYRPDSDSAALSEARIYAYQWRTRAALELVDAVLASNMFNADAWRLRGQLLLQSEKLEEARIAYDRAIAYSNVAFADRVSRALISYQLQDFDAVLAESAILLQLSPQHPSAQYIHGLVLFREGKYREASKAFAAAEPVARHYPLLLYYGSVSRLIDGDKNMAAVLAKQYLSYVPADARVRKLLAMIHLQDTNPAEARSVLQPALDYDPDDSEALTIKAHAMLMEARSGQAYDLFDRASRLRPDAPVDTLGLGLAAAGFPLTATQDAYLDTIKTGQRVFPLGDMLAIVRAVRAQDYDNALKLAESFLWTNTSDPSASAVLARVYLAADRRDEAVKTLQNGLRLAPGNIESSRLLGGLMSGSEQAEKALDIYAAALRHSPDAPEILVPMALLELDAGNRTEARKLLEQVVDVAPELLEPRLLLAALYDQLQRPASIARLFTPLDALQQRSPRVLATLANLQVDPLVYEDLRDQFEAIVEEDRDHLPSLFALASLAENNGSREEFELYLGAVARLAPNEPGVLRMRARAADAMANTADAVDYARRAFVRTPSQRALLDLADLHARSGRRMESREFMQRWLQINPFDNTVRVALAANLEASKELAGARIQYEAVLDAEPDNLVAANNLAWLIRHDEPARALQLVSGYGLDSVHSPALLDTRAVIENINGNAGNALEAIQRARKLAPTNATIRYHEAEILAGLGMNEQAIALLEELHLGDYGTFPELQLARELLSSLRDSG